MNNEPDNQPNPLVVQARAGDQAAFSQLVDVLSPDLKRVATRLIAGSRFSSVVNPEDIVQQSLLGAWQGIVGLQHETESMFRCWLMTIVRNTAYKAMRKAMQVGGGADQVQLPQSSSRPNLAPADQGPAPSSVARLAELRERLFSALAGISPVQRQGGYTGPRCR